MSFSDQLIRARKKAHLTQTQLSVRSGVSQQAISKLENGISSPSEYTMRQLANALRIPLADLLENGQKEKPATSEGDELMSEIISRVQVLPDQYLAPLSAFLDGLEAGRAISLAEPAATGPLPGSAEAAAPADLPDPDAHTSPDPSHS